jgi:hypothetical protein
MRLFGDIRTLRPNRCLDRSLWSADQFLLWPCKITCVSWSCIRQHFKQHLLNTVIDSYIFLLHENPYHGAIASFPSKYPRKHWFRIEANRATKHNWPAYGLFCPRRMKYHIRQVPHKVDHRKKCPSSNPICTGPQMTRGCYDLTHSFVLSLGERIRASTTDDIDSHPSNAA